MLENSTIGLSDQTLLLTGGTGSFGKRFVARVMASDQRPRKLIVFSRDELKQYEMAQGYSKEEMKVLRFFIGDIRDRERLYRALDGVDIVVHAAAMKQVPACEYNPIEAVKTNVLGAAHLIDAAIDRGVKRVVALSTDKAANPVNLYGATKLCSDKLFVAANSYSGNHVTKFSVVRYGNVIGSRGSVVPLFRRLASSGRIPVTDRRMTRFWITLDEGVNFVLSALRLSRGGEIFVPKIPSSDLLTMVEVLAPGCQIDEIGIRAGEKLHEILISVDDARHTLEYDGHYVILPSSFEAEDFADYKQARGGRECPSDFEYSSATNGLCLDRASLRDLLGRSDMQALQAASTAGEPS